MAAYVKTIVDKDGNQIHPYTTIPAVTGLQTSLDNITAGAGHTFSLAMNGTNLSINLKNSSNQVLSTDSIDLNVTSAVSNAVYDDTTHELTLTFGTGASAVTAVIDVADMVGGLVPTSRTINGQALTSNLTLNASNIGYSGTTSGMTADDVQEAIDELSAEKAKKIDIAMVESTGTASVAHPSGSYFYYNNVLYEATADIAVNDAISVGTNCKSIRLADETNDLKSALGYREWEYTNYEISYATKVPGTCLRYDKTTEPVSTIDHYKIPVSEGEKWKIDGTYYRAFAMYAFMDSSNAIIFAYPNTLQEAVYTNETQLITIPSGVSYLAVNDFTRISISAQFKVYEGIHADSIQQQIDEKASIEDIASFSGCFEEYIAASYVNLNDQSIEKVNQTMIRYDKSTESISTVNYYVIPVTEGDLYRISSGKRGAAAMYGFMDSQKNIIYAYPASAQPNVVVLETVDITIPNGVSYLAVNDLHGAYGSIVLAVYALDTYKILKDGRESLKTLKSALFELKLCTAGDSITEGEGTDHALPINERPTYGKLAAEHYGMDYINIGMSGRTMADVSVNGVSRNGFAIERYLLVPDDTDVLTIWFGWNDNAYGPASMRDDYCLSEYGNLYSACTTEQKDEADSHDWQTEFVGSIDSSNKKTWCGAWNFVLNYFTVTKPIKRLGVVIPFLPLGTYSVSMRNALKQICEKYGVSYIDSANPNQIPTVGYCDSERSTNYANYLSYRTAYTADTLHPNEDGYERISRGYIPWIAKI